jgi:hypothetical protein
MLSLATPFSAVAATNFSEMCAESVRDADLCAFLRGRPRVWGSPTGVELRGAERSESHVSSYGRARPLLRALTGPVAGFSDYPHATGSTSPLQPCSCLLASTIACPVLPAEAMRSPDADQIALLPAESKSLVGAA